MSLNLKNREGDKKKKIELSMATGEEVNQRRYDQRKEKKKQPARGRSSGNVKDKQDERCETASMSYPNKGVKKF